MTLRQVLFTGMDDQVHFDKAFTHYQQHDDGTVTAHFADVLVAADGANSAVRHQYLPHAEVTDAGIIAIGGKVPITAETKPLLPPTCFQGLSLVFAPKGRFCIWHVLKFKWDTSGQVKSGIGGNDAELIQRWPGLLFDNTRDYIKWGFWASTDKYPPGVMDLRGPDLIRLVLGLTPCWHPNLRRLFGLSDPGSCFRINIRTSVPVQLWRPSTITLLGDAIHTMILAQTAPAAATRCAGRWWAGSRWPQPAPASAPSTASPPCAATSSTASTPTAAANSSISAAASPSVPGEPFADHGVDVWIVPFQRGGPCSRDRSLRVAAPAPAATASAVIQAWRQRGP
jgi:hypothetical protein